MADQIEVAKLVQTAVVGPTKDTVSVTKLAMTVLLVPGDDDGTDTSNKQGHVHQQIIRRD